MGNFFPDYIPESEKHLWPQVGAGFRDYVPAAEVEARAAAIKEEQLAAEQARQASEARIPTPEEVAKKQKK